MGKAILYETPSQSFWIAKEPKGFIVYKAGVTHSTKVAMIGTSLGIQRAIIEADRREALMDDLPKTIESTALVESLRWSGCDTCREWVAHIKQLSKSPTPPCENLFCGDCGAQELSVFNEIG